MGSAAPYRIDLFDDEVESIRVFDPETQRSGERAQALRLLPAREFPLDRRRHPAVQAPLPQSLPRRPHAHVGLYRDIAEGAPPPGIEYYLPLFFDATATLFDYLPGNTIVAAESDVQGAAAQVFAEIASRYEQRGHDTERPILEPAELFTPIAELMQRLAALRRIELSRVELDPLMQSLPYQNFATRAPPACASMRAAKSRRATSRASSAISRAAC